MKDEKDKIFNFHLQISEDKQHVAFHVVSDWPIKEVEFLACMIDLIDQFHNDPSSLYNIAEEVDLNKQ